MIVPLIAALMLGPAFVLAAGNASPGTTVDGKEDRALGGTAPTENHQTSRLDLLPGGEISSSPEMIFKPLKRVPYSHTHESTAGGIKARLAGAPDGVPYITQVLPFDDNSISLSVGVDLHASRHWMQHLTCDRQIATNLDAESFFAKVMFTM
jgi:hypothetical protein